MLYSEIVMLAAAHTASVDIFIILSKVCLGSLHNNVLFQLYISFHFDIQLGLENINLTRYMTFNELIRENCDHFMPSKVNKINFYVFFNNNYPNNQNNPQAYCVN